MDGELYCTHVREEVRRGQPEDTKRRDDPGVRKRMDIKEKIYIRLYFITLLNYFINTQRGWLE